MLQSQRHRTPEQCAQAQLEAYNNRDIDAFSQVYADHIQLISLPEGNVFCSGIDDLRTRYGQQFDDHRHLHCNLVSRISCPPFVIDEEHVTGLRSDGGIVHAVATYECRDGYIVRAWFLREEQP